MNNIVLSEKNSNNSSLKKYLNEICVLDTTYKKKQKMLNTLYQENRKLYREGNNSEIVVILNDLYDELKNNNENLYKHRMNVVDFIRKNNGLTPEDKKHVSNYLINMFNADVSLDEKDPEDNMVCCLKPEYSGEVIEHYDDGNKGVTVSTLDKAYLQKHNELTQMFKAYQILFKKVGEYKTKMDKFKKLSTSPLISKNNMKKMLDDQKYMMDSVDKMQQYLVNQNVLKPEERVPTKPVVSHPNNLRMFNSQLKGQIENVLGANKNLNDKAKMDIINMIKNKIGKNNEIMLIK